MAKTNYLVCGIGANDRKYAATDVSNNVLKEYGFWKHMLFRCTGKSWKRNPCYTGTTCSENFKSYTYFYEWCQKQIGFNNKDIDGNSWNLDKDLLIKGNNVYSEVTCVFIPQRLNKLLTKREARRGEHLIGVYRRSSKSRFTASCNNGFGKSVYIGSFNTQQEAFQAYKTFKEALIKQVANEYKHLIDNRAYQALMNYEVNEND